MPFPSYFQNFGQALDPALEAYLAGKKKPAQAPSTRDSLADAWVPPVSRGVVMDMSKYPKFTQEPYGRADTNDEATASIAMISNPRQPIDFFPPPAFASAIRQGAEGEDDFSEYMKPSLSGMGGRPDTPENRKRFSDFQAKMAAEAAAAAKREQLGNLPLVPVAIPPGSRQQEAVPVTAAASGQASYSPAVTGQTSYRQSSPAPLASDMFKVTKRDLPKPIFSIGGPGSLGFLSPDKKPGFYPATEAMIRGNVYGPPVPPPDAFQEYLRMGAANAMNKMGAEQLGNLPLVPVAIPPGSRGLDVQPPDAESSQARAERFYNLLDQKGSNEYQAIKKAVGAQSPTDAMRAYLGGKPALGMAQTAVQPTAAKPAISDEEAWGKPAKIEDILAAEKVAANDGNPAGDKPQTAAEQKSQMTISSPDSSRTIQFDANGRQIPGSEVVTDAPWNTPEYKAKQERQRDIDNYGNRNSPSYAGTVLGAPDEWQSREYDLRVGKLKADALSQYLKNESDVSQGKLAREFAASESEKARKGALDLEDLRHKRTTDRERLAGMRNPVTGELLSPYEQQKWLEAYKNMDKLGATPPSPAIAGSVYDMATTGVRDAMNMPIPEKTAMTPLQAIGNALGPLGDEFVKGTTGKETVQDFLARAGRSVGGDQDKFYKIIPLLDEYLRSPAYGSDRVKGDIQGNWLTNDLATVPGMRKTFAAVPFWEAFQEAVGVNPNEKDKRLRAYRAWLATTPGKDDLLRR